MQLSFDPQNLTDEASLNNVELGDLPGADPSYVGRPAFEVLSLHALAVGTYLGSGFPPPPDRRLPLVPDFRVQDA